MAARVPASQLLLIALLSWNVHCFPAKKDWSQPNYEGSRSNMEVPPGLHYSSSHGAPIQPSTMNHPAVSFLHNPERRYPSPVRSRLTARPSSEASWNVAPGWDPVEESTTAHSVSRTSQPRPGIGLPPPPPLFQAGELAHYEDNLVHGTEERETEELNLVPPPPPPYPGPLFQAGELDHYESVLEHGNEERETETEEPIYAHGSRARESESLMRLPPFELYNPPTSNSNLQPAPPAVSPVGPSKYYLFLTGQLPPGTFSHFESDYESGIDHWDDVHYERYHFPIAQSPVISPQTQEVPSDALWRPLDTSLKQ
ncbi:uncharacterized protein [Trachinotus anak]|uniref:uncharacterized protein n=1 Tax=Trachinotus anak TaxID=443729 RepID=UPI0039F1EE66